jgi:hypothetical protein
MKNKIPVILIVLLSLSIWPVQKGRSCDNTKPALSNAGSVADPHPHTTGVDTYPSIINLATPFI